MLQGYDPYPPEMAGLFKKIKKAVKRAVTPPKHIRKKIAKLKKKVAKKLKPPKWVQKAMIIPKWARPLLTPPKAIRKHVLGKAASKFIKAIKFLPIPGARVVSAALKALQTASKMAVEYDEARRMARRAAEQQAAQELKRAKKKGLTGLGAASVEDAVAQGLKVVAETMNEADSETMAWATEGVVEKRVTPPWMPIAAGAGVIYLVTR